MSKPGKFPSAYSAPSAPPAWQQQQQQPGYGQQQQQSPYSHSQPPTSSPYSQPNSSSWGQSYSPYSASPGSGAAGYSPYGYPPQGGYGAQYPPQSPFPPGTDPEIVRVFQAADRDGSGSVDDIELQKVLSFGKPFSIRTVRLMILMYGSRDSRKIGPKEFAILWNALRDWKVIFERFDRDRSGSIDKSEMREALLSLGYSISAPILDCLLQKYDHTGQAKAMDYDSFVECGLLVKGLTERFKEQDTQLTGSATLNYQTFMLMVLPFIVA